MGKLPLEQTQPEIIARIEVVVVAMVCLARMLSPEDKEVFLKNFEESIGNLREAFMFYPVADKYLEIVLREPQRLTAMIQS